MSCFNFAPIPLTPRAWAWLRLALNDGFESASEVGEQLHGICVCNMNHVNMTGTELDISD